MASKRSRLVTIGKYGVAIASLGVVFCVALVSAQADSRAISARPLSDTEISAIVGDGFCRRQKTCDFQQYVYPNKCEYCDSETALWVCCYGSGTCVYDGEIPCNNADLFSTTIWGSPADCGSCNVNTEWVKVGLCVNTRHATGTACDPS